MATRIPLEVSHQGEEPLGGWGLEKVSKTDLLLRAAPSSRPLPLCGPVDVAADG